MIKIKNFKWTTSKTMISVNKLDKTDLSHFSKSVQQEIRRTCSLCCTTCKIPTIAIKNLNAELAQVFFGHFLKLMVGFQLDRVPSYSHVTKNPTERNKTKRNEILATTSEQVAYAINRWSIRVSVGFGNHVDACLFVTKK